VDSGIHPFHRRRRVSGEVDPPPGCQSTPRLSSPDACPPWRSASSSMKMRCPTHLQGM
jgi:hypothetical protein